MKIRQSDRADALQVERIVNCQGAVEGQACRTVAARKVNSAPVARVGAVISVLSGEADADGGTRLGDGRNDDGRPNSS